MTGLLEAWHGIPLFVIAGIIVALFEGLTMRELEKKGKPPNGGKKVTEPTESPIPEGGLTA